MNNLTPDQLAAHDFLTELRTRITTQPLPYQHGVESRALESLWEVFAQARAAIKKNPGCETFAGYVTQVLNLHVRPVTAKWHRAKEEGRLESKDGADEFRLDLENTQKELRNAAVVFYEMAYGTKKIDRLTPPAISEEELNSCLAPLQFGIPADLKVSDDKTPAINANEKADVQKRRGENACSISEGMDAAGLALSGGGIRSATFSLGVAQVLADKNLLKDFDFLSTVSGGGYTGSFLTTRLGTDTDHDVAGPNGPDPAPVRYLRQNAKFLAARTLKESWSMVTATLAGMILNWTVPVLLILLAALGVLSARKPILGLEWKWPVWVSGAVTLFCLVIYVIALRYGRKATRWSGGLLGLTLAITIFIGMAWVLKWGYFQYSTATLNFSATSTAIIAAIVAATPTIIRFLPILKNPKVRKVVMSVALWLAGVILPVMAVVLFYAFIKCGVDLHNQTFVWSDDLTSPLHRVNGLIILWLIAAFLALIDLFFLNINLTAPHRLYRDGLARTFVQLDDNDADVPLNGINSNGKAPYHLLNATLNIPSSTSPAVRDRRCDFFMFSKHWCGSPGTGYLETSKWRTNGQPVDLGTVMAVSGAAVSSYMGLGSKPTLTALLTFLNVRLGFWIRNPKRKGASKQPGFLCLLREMLGMSMSEKRAWLNLSDGGHIENMGVYELLRRRCKFIVCVDGEADPGYLFEGLMTLIRHAQIDLGVRIAPVLDELRPDPIMGRTQAHAHLSRIYYPAIGEHPAGLGLLLYLKLSITGNETELIRRYRTNHPEFPHQTTLDQFFDQEQFEAYRQLGVHVAQGLFSRALLSKRDDGPAASLAQGDTPGTVREWFHRLARNLLESDAHYATAHAPLTNRV